MKWPYAWKDIYNAYRIGYGPILSAWFASVDIAHIHVGNWLEKR